MNIKNIQLLMGLCFAILTSGYTHAQTTLPYFTGFDNANQKTGWQMFRKGNSNSNYEWMYSNVNPYSPVECLYHGYPVGQTTLVTDDWFVSPPFTIAANGKIDSIRYSFAGFGMPGAGDTVAIYLLKGNADPALASSKTLLYDYRGDKYINSPDWNATPSINLPATTGNCYIAIRYHTINNWLDVKFDNIRISGNAPTSVIDENASQYRFVTLYPNPATTNLHIKSSEPIAETIIYDVMGRQVYRSKFETQIDVSKFRNGIYTMTSISSKGAVGKTQFAKK